MQYLFYTPTASSLSSGALPDVSYSVEIADNNSNQARPGPAVWRESNGTDVTFIWVRDRWQ